MLEPVQLDLIVGVCLHPVPGNLLARGNTLMPLEIVDQLAQGPQSGQFSYEPAVQADAVHLELAATALFIHDIEGELGILEPILIRMRTITIIHNEHGKKSTYPWIGMPQVGRVFGVVDIQGVRDGQQSLVCLH